MALLICGMIITIYAVVLTVLHMKQLEDMEELDALRGNSSEQEKIISGLRMKIRHTEWQLDHANKNARDDFEDYKAREEALLIKLNESRRENARLLGINNKLMERIKKIT